MSNAGEAGVEADATDSAPIRPRIECGAYSKARVIHYLSDGCPAGSRLAFLRPCLITSDCSAADKN